MSIIRWNRSCRLSCLGWRQAAWLEQWPKPPDEFTRTHIQRFGDAIDEINERGLDMRGLSPKLMSQRS
ncbi:hypothetical protein XH84_31355 [Bradyrhizobium nanningense]|nr:hypothetical protein XH84_31355 [Bradyrhizobium nanningense]